MCYYNLVKVEVVSQLRYYSDFEIVVYVVIPQDYVIAVEIVSGKVFH